MANPIQLKRSSTAGNVPPSLADGEVAIQQADGVFFYRNASGAINKSLLPKRATVADAAYSASINDVYIGYTSLTASRTITLPSAANYPVGHALVIADESGNCSASSQITIASASGDTIGGLTSITLNSPYQKVALHSNGVKTWTFASIAVNGKSGNSITLNATDVGAWYDGASLSQAGKVDVARKVYNVATYGAVTSADSTTAINNAITALLANPAGGTLYFPDIYPGTGTFTISLAAGQNIEIRGRGSRQSGISLTAGGTNGGLIISGSGTSTIKIQGFGISANSCPNWGAGANGSLVYVKGGGLQRTIVINDLYVAGTASARPANYLYIVNPYFSVFNDIIVEGAQGTFGSVGKGIVLIGDGSGICPVISMKGVQSNRVQYGLYVVTGIANNTKTVEGVCLTDFSFEGVQIGIQVTGNANPYLAPGFTFIAGHINATKYCFALDAVAQAKIKECLLYLDVSQNPQSHIQLTSYVDDLKIEGNTINMVDTTGSGTTVNLASVTVPGRADVTHIDLHGNMFAQSASSYILSVAAGAGAVRHSKNTKRSGSGGNLVLNNGSFTTDQGGNLAY